jgi:hypothetical protein
MSEVHEDKPELNDEVAKIVKAEATTWLREIKSNIKNKLEYALLSLLGLEKNGYRIDHCNGRNSVLIDILREEAKEEIRKIAKNIPFKNDLGASFVETAFKNEFRRNLENEVKDLARKMAQQKAVEVAQKYTDRELAKYLK